MNLLEALNSITQKDLDDVVGKITSLEAELDQLKELRKVIEIRLGVRKPLGAHLRGKGRPRKSKDETSEAETSDPGEPGAFRSPSGGGQYTATERHRIEARKFLMANGPTKPRRGADSEPQGGTVMRARLEILLTVVCCLLFFGSILMAVWRGC